MSKMNILVYLNAYQDENTTNSPSLNNLKWTREINGVTIREPLSASISLASGQTIDLFSGTVALISTPASYDIALKAGTSNTYVITSNVANTFRTGRSLSSDATTEITVTKNGPILTYTSTGGTPLSLIAGNVVVNDEVRIGTGFNIANQGKFKILALTATSLQIENNSGVAEGPIVLGAGFATNLRIYSNAGIQTGDKVDLVAGFSSVTQGLYEITDVTNNYIEIYSINSLPTESAITNSPTALNVYRDGREFIYLESDKKVEITINNATTPIKLDTFTFGTKAKPGMFLLKGPIYSVQVENTSTDSASIFYLITE